MRRVLGLAATLAVLSLAACSSVRTSYDYDPSAARTMAGYGSYGWLPHPQGNDPQTHNQLLETRVVASVDQELSKKGYRRIGDGTPDFHIGWHTSVEGKIDVSTVNNYYGYGYGYWGAGGGWGYTDTYVRNYNEGTLIIDVVDVKSNQLVWRGIAKAEVSMGGSPEARQALITEAVQKTLKEFPPEWKQR